MAEEAPGTSVGEIGDMATKEEENVMSMVDVLQENQQLEAEATAVLGDSDDKFCTYPQGYLARQALYACGTCSSSPNPPAGICLACSYECHEGHQLFELYTKRHFRCDCGNSNFPNLTCKLEPNKAPTNADNKYNDNFSGVYCICKRPYPDPEDEIEDEMIQCVVCEDWYHGRHVGSVDVPDNEDYQEMVCCPCMKKCDFLWAYSVHSLETKIVKEETIDSVDVEGNTESAVVEDKKEIKKQESDTDTASKEDPAKSCTSAPNPKESEESSKDIKENVDATSKPSEDTSAVLPQKSTSKSDIDNDKSSVDTNSATTQQAKSDLHNGDKPETSSTTPKPVDTKVPKTELKEANSTNNNDTPVKDEEVTDLLERNGETLKEDEDSQLSNLDSKCKLKELEARGVYRGEHATFWPTGWRSKLCTCEGCKSMYAEKSVAFLVDESDSVLAYEQRGLSRQASSSSQYEQGMQALSNMNRIQQVEMLHGFNDLKAELTSYLKDFADQGKVVKREDIDKFFDDMQARKRQRIGGVGAAVQYHCR